jgi:hypothetical protein
LFGYSIKSESQNPRIPEPRLHHIKIMVMVQDCGCYYLIPIIPTHNWGPSTKRVNLPLFSSAFHSTILSNTSRTVLKQKFTNPSTDDPIKKCVYTFPLYDGVSVVKFTAKFGKTVLRGTVKEKFEAKKLFDEAGAKGETAGLLEQAAQASDVFSTKLGNIPAGESVTVEITYIGELKAGDSEGTRFTIPASIAPRYGNGPSESNHFYGHAEQDKGGIRIVVDIDIPDGSLVKGVESPSHPIAVSIGTVSTAQAADPVMSKAFATLSLGGAALDKDFVLIIHTKHAGLPKALLETHSKIPHQRAIMATLVPKFSLPPSRPEIVFVADRSGSMRGNIRVLISAMGVFLKSMPAGVKFNICSFGSSHSFLWPKSKSYNAETLEEASNHIKGFQSNYGGTETFKAIKATIEQRWRDIPLEVMLLTDGDIWAQEKLFSYLNNEVEASKGQIRLFPLGIGNGVSHGLIEGVARAGRGFAQAVQNGERLDAAVVRMLRSALSPHITDYTLEVKYGKTDDDFEVVDAMTAGLKVLLNDPKPTEKPKISLFDTAAEPEKGNVEAGDLKVPDIPRPKLLQAPHKIPSLFPFSRTSVYIILSPDTISRNPTSVVFKATSEHGPLELEIPIEVLPEKGQTVHQLAARKATQDLEENRGWIFDARDQNGTLISSRYPSSFDELVKREAVRLGERFQVVNKWCSFVAVRANDKAVSVVKEVEVAKKSVEPPMSNENIRFGPLKLTKPDHTSQGGSNPTIPPAVDLLQDFDFDSFLHTTETGNEEEKEESDDEDMGYALFDSPNTPPAASAPPPPPAAPQVTLQNYQMQNMVLEQQNKNRLEMARQEAPEHSLPYIGYTLKRFATDTSQFSQQASTFTTAPTQGSALYQSRDSQNSSAWMARAIPPGSASSTLAFASPTLGTGPSNLFGGITTQPVSSEPTPGMPTIRKYQGMSIGQVDKRFVPTSFATQPTDKKKKLADLKFGSVSRSDILCSPPPQLKNWKTATPAEKIHALLELQSFDGSWSAEKLAEIEAILGGEVGENPMGGDLGTWVTVVVVKFMEMKMGEEEQVWGLVGEKAREWLAVEGTAGAGKESEDGLEREAEKWVTGLDC